MSTARLTDDRARGFTSTEVSDARYSKSLDDQASPDEQESYGMVRGFLAQGSRVLDVGCGTAEFACGLRDSLGCEVVGVEPHEGRATVAKSRGITVLDGFLTSQTLAGVEPFDAVTFMDVLEHVPDPVELMLVAAAALKPGGVLIISVPNIAHWTIRLKLLGGRFDYRPTGIMDATHLRWFTQRTIREVVLAAGLKVRYQDVSRGHWLHAYYVRFPWRFIKPSRRRSIINWLCERKPAIFGVQHFVVASL